MIKVYDSNNTPDLREKFVKAVTTVFMIGSNFLDFIEDEEYSNTYDCFSTSDDECYIINRETGEYINWYKFTHVGRDIHTTVEPDNLTEFLRRFLCDY